MPQVNLERVVRRFGGVAAVDEVSISMADGAFVTFWRLLVKYPEILAWERLWNEALNDTYRDMYRKSHEIAPAKGIGWHVWHNNTFSPFYRAEQDYGEDVIARFRAATSRSGAPVDAYGAAIVVRARRPGSG